MRVVARRREGYVHDVDIEEGAHSIVVDEPVAAGGTDAGPGPSRLVAAGLASCIAATMEMYANRKEWDLGAVEVTVDVEYERYVPSSFEVSIQLSGDLSDEQRERLLVIAGKCPVHKVVAEEMPIRMPDRIEPL
jgi:putative redox protein